MLSRALSLATVTLLIGCFAADPAHSQATNLEAGKSPSQIFAGTCTACHKGPRGLLKTVPAGSLSSFLRQHYTTSSEMASLLSSFLISNGASDTRNVAGSKQAKDAKPEAKPAGSPEQVDRQGHKLRPQEAAKPDADGLTPQGRKRLARPGEAPDASKPAAEGQPPVQAAVEHGPEGRKSAARLKLGRGGKPGSEEPPKGDTAKTEPSTSEPVKDDQPKSETAKGEGNKPEGEAKSETAKSEPAKSETAKSEATKSESAKIDAPKATGSGEAPVLRADPVPPVTPAPPSPPAATAAVSSSPEPVAGSSAPAPSAASAALPAPPAVTASAPPPAPIAPAGPPAPPISQ